MNPSLIFTEMRANVGGWLVFNDYDGRGDFLHVFLVYLESPQDPGSGRAYPQRDRSGHSGSARGLNAVFCERTGGPYIPAFFSENFFHRFRPLLISAGRIPSLSPFHGFMHDPENLSAEDREEDIFVRPKRTWKRKFQDAFRGLRQSVHQQSSYKVHFLFLFLVVIAGFLLRLDTVRWSLIVICICMVLAGEMLNTSIETLSKAVTRKFDEHIAKALNIASGAILVLSIGAAIVGLIVFLESFMNCLS